MLLLCFTVVRIEYTSLHWISHCNIYVKFEFNRLLHIKTIWRVSVCKPIILLSIFYNIPIYISNRLIYFTTNSTIHFINFCKILCSIFSIFIFIITNVIKLNNAIFKLDIIILSYYPIRKYVNSNCIPHNIRFCFLLSTVFFIVTTNLNNNFQLVIDKSINLTQ